MRLGLYGGSFNPVHCGHVRAAVEAREGLGLDTVRLVVAADPPHKPGPAMPGFALRFAMVRAAVQGLEGVEADPMESERSGPSYTVDTLNRCRRDMPGAELVFILGSESFSQLRIWRRGLELPGLAQLAVVGRGGADLGKVGADVLAHWPGAEQPEPGLWRLPGGGLVRYLDAPRLDVSSTDVRRRWVEGRSLRCLVPEAVLGLIAANKEELARCWAGASP